MLSLASPLSSPHIAAQSSPLSAHPFPHSRPARTTRRVQSVQACEQPVQAQRAREEPYISTQQQCSRRSILLQGSLTAVGLTAFKPRGAAAYIVDEDIATSVFDAVRPSVVSIAVTRQGENLGTGTGLVWTQDGYIVTNYHVVSKIDKASDVLTIVTQAGDGSLTTSTAKVAASDTMNDITVLKANGQSFQPPKIGTSSDLKVGQSVFAVGFPYGLPASLASGVVSGLNRSIPSPVGTRVYGCIQTDACINGGNSGGPLLDSAGRVVGIATATYSRQGSGRGSGVNFALPMDKVMKVVPQLIVYGTASGKRV